MARITSDAKASELISKSLSGILSEEEKEALHEYVPESEEAKSFAHLSSLIHRSITEVAKDESTPTDRSVDSSSGPSPGLSDYSKARLKKLLKESVSGQAYENETGFGLRNVATNTEIYSVDDNGAAPFDEERKAVSRFTLLQKIGQGGLGNVWLARDEKLRRNVALKEMLPKAAGNKKLLQRFQREAEITGHLEHPNVVPLYMSGVDPETGAPFYAMRFLGKRTLSDAIKEYHSRRAAGVDEPIDLHRLLTAFLDVCQAIAFAHSRGVIHRDLKPENVALDNFGQVLVLDWGLAKLESDGELSMRFALSGHNGDSQLGNTLDGDVVGTPLYMSPEQAAGKLDEVDARTDVYGLGAILFAILTGDAPHENSHRSSSGSLKVTDFLDAIVANETPLPRNTNSDVPSELEAICVRAMAKEKYARHASATELATAVEQWMAGKNEKEARYDALRMTASDLKSRLCVQVRQLIASAQFMVELPPIQELLKSLDEDADEFATWRERLSTIFLALAKSRPNMSGLSYAQVDDDRINELVRIERSMMDVANVRTVPQSRLRRGVSSTFHKMVIQQFPGEHCIDFDCTTAGTVRLVCGVPVFDEATEEPFGMVAAEAEIGNLVKPELDMIDTRCPVYLIDDAGNFIYTFNTDANIKQRPAHEIIPRWEEMAAALKKSTDYVDPDRIYYATRLSGPQHAGGLHIVFQVDE